jgi:multidrug efflux pump subunit AcrA (membrane-fusion protein)
MPVVATLTVRGASLPDGFRVRGIIRPWREIAVRSPLQARVVALHVEPGHRVDADQLLVELDGAGLQRSQDAGRAAARLADAEARLIASGVERVRQEEERLRAAMAWASSLADLLDRSITSPEVRRSQDTRETSIMRAPLQERARERALAAVSRAEEALVRLRMQRSLVETARDEMDEAAVRTLIAKRSAEETLRRYTKITSPAKGTVSRCRVSPDEVVSAGQPILTLIDTDHVKALLWIPPHRVAGVKHGTAALVRPDGAEGRWSPATVSRVSPLPDPRTGQYLAEVELDNEDARLSVGLLVDAILPPSD